MKKLKILSLILVSVLCLSCMAACETGNGKIYTLQEAYDKGLVSAEELQSIANHVNILNYPKVDLSDQTVAKIKQVAAEYFVNENSDDKNYPITAGEDIIFAYFGTYSKGIAARLWNGKISYYAVEQDITEEIGGITFHYNTPERVYFWTE